MGLMVIEHSPCRDTLMSLGHPGLAAQIAAPRPGEDRERMIETLASLAHRGGAKLTIEYVPADPLVVSIPTHVKLPSGREVALDDLEFQDNYFDIRGFWTLGGSIWSEKTDGGLAF